MSEKSLSWVGRSALITGASSGIGAATARLLAAQGIIVLLTARREKRLQTLAAEIIQAGGRAFIFPADLSVGRERVRLHGKIEAQVGAPDILVNNAGFGWYGYFGEMPWETAQEMLSVNACATAHLTRLFLPGMRRRGSGHIINVGSISAEIPSQGVVMYSASKSFVDAFNTALHRELSGAGLHASIVRAGPVHSEFFKQVAKRPGGLSIPVERFAIPAEQVARRIWGLLLRPKRAVYVPRLFFLTPWVELLFGWLEDRLGPLLLRYQTNNRHKIRKRYNPQRPLRNKKHHEIKS